MGLYDRYNLANSTQIPQYAGSTLNEMTKVADVMQNRYDQAQAYDDYLAEQDKYAKVHEKDRPLYDQTMQGYRQKIKERAKSGNYEDMVRATAQDARGFGRDYAAFADNLQRRTAYRDDLEKQRKDLNLSADTFNKLLAASEYNTKGLQRDPTTGRVTGQFQGITANKELDLAKWTDEKIKGIVAKENGWDITTIENVQQDPDGQYRVTRGGKTVTVDGKRISNILAEAVKLDPELQGSIKQTAMLNTVGTERTTPDQVKDVALRTKIQAMADKNGVGFGQAFQAYNANQIQNSLLGSINKYGVLKREQHDTERNFGIGSELEGSAAKRKELADNVRFMIPDGDAKFDEKMKDPTLLQQTSLDATNSITSLKEQLGKPNITPEDRRDIISKLQQAQSTKTSSESILNGAKQAVASRLGYADYNKALAGEVIKEVGDKSIHGEVNGRPVTVPGKEIADAIRANRVTTTPNGGFGNLTTVTLADGRKFQTIAMPKVDIQRKVDQEVKDNAEKYAYKPTQVSLSKPEAEGLEKLYQGSPGAFDIRSSDNQTKPITDPDDLPKDLRFTSTHVTKVDGSVVLKGREYDEKGKPTDRVFYARPLPGNNANIVIGKNLMKKTQDRDMMLAGASLINNDWSGTVAGLQDREKQPIVVPDGNSGRTIGFVERVPSSIISGKSRYIITDSKGQRINSYDDINAASLNIQNVVDKETAKYYQNQK